MGIDVFQYLGAFVKLTPKTEVVYRKHRGCSNPQCVVRGFNDTQDFCSKCGSKVIDKVTPEDVPITWAQWSDDNDFVDELISYHHDDNEFLFPNGSSKATVIDLDDDCDSTYQPLKVMNPDQYIFAFRKEYSKVLEKLTETGLEYEIVFGYFRGWQ